jgi:hypothetical protein
LHKIFGGKTCLSVASQLKGVINDLIVFSIYSDERLPDGLENYLKNESIPQNLIIIGDFTSYYPSQNESPASYEAIKLALTHSKLKTLNVCWINGIKIKHDDIQKNLKWTLFSLTQLEPEENKNPSFSNNIKYISGVDKLTYQKICNILRFPVYFQAEKNRISSIDLTDNKAYPRGLTNNLTQDQTLNFWDAMYNLKHLSNINLSFNAMPFLPDLTKFSHLEKLDLRGNSNLDFSKLHEARTLSYLNISACELTELPASISSLENLKSLLAYKNYISDISNTILPNCIERISLYRNRICNNTLQLDYCDRLQEINLGANPIINMTLYVSPKLHTLKIRARYIKKSIIIVANQKTTICISED